MSQPPAYAGAYQGYPQWCSSPKLNATACWVGGGLCTSNPNATLPGFTQTEYETCMREQRSEQCLVCPPSSLCRHARNSNCCFTASEVLRSPDSVVCFATKTRFSGECLLLMEPDAKLFARCTCHE